MLTNFVLNQNNILSNYSKPQPVKSQLSNKQVEKIVKQQDIVVNRFVNTLDNNIQNYLIGNIGKKDINLFLPIKNALWQLWNESWFLGQINAAEELRAAKFSSGDSLVTFNADDLLRADRKQRREEAKRTEAINELQGFNERYKTNGEFDVDKILRTSGKRRNDVTDEQINRSIRALQKEEDELYTRISGTKQTTTKQKVEKKERAAKKQIEKTSNAANNERELTQEERERFRDNIADKKGIDTEDNRTTRINPVRQRKDAKEKLPFEDTQVYPDDTKTDNTYRQVAQLRRQQEKTIAPDLERTKFGQAYLDKRFNEVSKSLNQKFVFFYKDELVKKDENGKVIGGIVPDYFNDNRSDKDKSYVTKIRRMYISNARDIDEYKYKDAVLSSIITSYEQPEIIDRTGIIKREISRLQEELRGKSIKQKQLYFDRINELKKELTNEPKRIKQEIAKSEDKSKQFISISQEDKEKLGLTKNSYSIKELEKIRSDVRKQIRQQDQNFYNTKRIALTELNAAYNLGRLDYYLEKGIEYVRWDVSVEHERRRLNPSNNKDDKQGLSDAGTIRSYNSKRYKGKPFQGSVCPVCWERNGEVYSISRVVNDAELQIPVHPFCACILVPVKDDDDDNPKKKKKFKVKTSDLLNNSVLKWAAGAGVAILGTAAMYAAFRMTRGKVVQPPLQDQIPKVTKLLPKVIQAPDYIKDGANSVVDTIVDNQDQLLQQAMKTKAKVVNTVKDEVIPVDIPTALPELQPKPKLLQPALIRDEIELDVIPLGIPDKQIDITPYQAVINNSVNKVNPNTTTTYNDDVTSTLEEVIKQKREFNLITPTHVTNTVRTEVDEIRTRLTQYQSYLRKDLTAAERNRIIQDYRNDITKLNTIISKYEKDNVLIYGEIKGLTNLRDEGEQLIARNLDKAATDNAKVIFANSEIGRKINNELVELNEILRSRINDTAKENTTSYYAKAKQLKQQITTSNSELTLDYLNSIKRNIINSVDNLPNFPTAIDDSLNNLTNLLRQTDKLTSEQFFEYSEALDELTEIVKSIDRRITPTLLDVDLQTVIANTTRSSDKNKELLATSQFLLDYQDGIRQIYNRINNLNVALILKFNTITN